jgi:hypothetical protein
VKAQAEEDELVDALRLKDSFAKIAIRRRGPVVLLFDLFIRHPEVRICSRSP